MGDRAAAAIRLGCDPEAQLIQILRKGEQKIVPASNYLKNENLSNGEPKPGWGLDGCPSVAELRSKPGGAKDAFVLAAELKAYMKDVLTLIPPDIKMVAGSATGLKLDGSYKPTGGHIHIAMDQHTETRCDMYADVFDYMLMIPLLFLEDPARAALRRKGSSYGNLWNSIAQRIGSGDAVRSKSYGLEYRPPSSWIVNESHATQVLALAHTIAYEIERGKSLPRFSEVFSGKALTQACLAHRESDRRFFWSHVNKIYTLIKTSALFNTKYTKVLRDLFSIINLYMQHNKTWREDLCILTGWGYPRDYTAFEVEDPNFPIYGAASDIGVSDILYKLTKKRYLKRIYLYGMSDKYGVNFSLSGDFGGAEIDPEYLGDNHETRVPAQEYACWIGISKDARLNADTGWIVDQIESFLCKLEWKKSKKKKEE